ncbi:MAG: rod shape-determining protein MreC [Paludibacteraceae bacterium]|nr:rod shape-determining protein MreC [Paludibacteraceae bacterium]
MKNLLQFLARYSNFLIFLILEVVAFILIATSHQYQHSAIWSSANRIVAGLDNITTTVGDYFQLKKDNQLLIEENAWLKNQLTRQANQLEKYVEIDSLYQYSHLDVEYIPAKVIGLTTHKHHNYLTINKGQRDSIEVDMGVICHDGVVGIVSAVSEKYSLVVPLIHTEMHTSCRLKKNDYIGRTQWRGIDYKKVELKDISRHVDVAQGDSVVTSGLTSVFPGGILVGTVESCELTDGDNYYHITMRPTTDYRKLKYVQVIRNHVTYAEEEP